MSSSRVAQSMPRALRKSSRRPSASSIVGAIRTVQSDVLLIVSMSRPASAQWPASTSSLRGSSSKPEVKFAISACSAISRSVFFSP